MTDQQKQRLLELTADLTTGDLDHADGLELSKLQNEFPGLDAESMEYAAAAATLAMIDPTETVPVTLRDKLLADAPAHLGATVHRMPQRQAPEATPSGKAPAPWGWLVAAALLIAAITGWWPEPPAPPEPSEPTVSERLAALQLDAPDLTTIDFGATEDPYATGSSGKVYWSNQRQEGYMRISGLHANDPGQDQYQLWIFDKTRDQSFPVDGGVFDIPPGDEVIIPIDARLAVAEPALFAVTVEVPGGVVVSKRERIVLAAQVN